MLTGRTATLTFSISVVQAGAVASADELKATASAASIPVTEVDYIEIASVAQIDITGRYRFIEEMAIVVDVARKSVQKRLADAQALADSIANELAKLNADSFALTDSLTQSHQKSISDTQAFSEALAKLLARTASDSVVAVDAPRLSLGKALASAFSLTDSSVQAALKGLSDSISTTEAFEAVLVFIRNASDAINATDGTSILFLPRTVEELILVSELAPIGFSKALGDAVSMDDGTSVGDGSTYFFQKSLHNVAFALDVSALGVSKASTDQFTTLESGVVSMQDYCDITYFAEDYVGISTTF
jgi:hypothetical protein